MNAPENVIRNIAEISEGYIGGGKGKVHLGNTEGRGGGARKGKGQGHDVTF